MKNLLKNFLFLLPLVFVLSCSPKDLSIQIVSFNIRYDNPDDGNNRWQHRIPIVKSYLTSEMPDIIGMQEVLHNQILDLQEMLVEYDYVGTGRNDNKTSGEYAPIFYNKNKFNLVDHSQFWLSETPDIPGSKSWDASLTRIVTWAQLEDKSSGKNLYVFNTHFDHRGVEARMNSAKLMAKKILEIAGDAPVLATGDFNIRKDHPSLGNALYENLIKSFKEISSLENTAHISKSPVASTGLTSTGFRPDWESREGYAIDYVFVNNYFEVEEHRVDKIVEGELFISDHWPIVAKVKLIK
ncbi:endonuclease/exonuclease/phosphatase family protein [Cyclobacterium sp. 1_MG-2023]|uniref:endonuclease/exonuclease/phosphatase family protein n=1 Tax=Cyclobacterium sp. 1_MG-2023 TaxID=3062681 RepID=UPI0026E313F6|nr:endonuclease/exonuclease/phosphatase family protein [Cyclobacterium sp. 1_MG-2023]MDO6439244.1 endonuclease/exonuclease/phosphatase family protein [Cyclobacterium sp. 1_MG-2023]